MLQTQEELDEQFARQLALSEQQQQTDQWLQTNAGVRSPGVYQPRTGRQARTPLPSAGQAQERPSEFQEQFSKFAESESTHSYVQCPDFMLFHFLLLNVLA